MTSSAVKKEKAIFAAGCFWGVQHSIKKVKGVLATSVGFTGGSIKNPAYNEVCSGKTGHAEAVEVVFDPAETTYETLAKFFFEIHNPALISKADAYKRSQYRSAIFYVNEEQKNTAEKLVALLKEQQIEVATEITPAAIFYPAEEYHQHYYSKKGKTNYEYRYKKKF